MTQQELISNRIAHYCQQQRLTYYKLSYKAAVPLTTLLHILDGSTKNPGIFTIAKICNGLGITVTEFLSSEEFQNFESGAE